MPFTIINRGTSYRGSLQKERDINSVRIKDKLHIFTGTYPLYYKGDGKLYMYPQYIPDPVEILRFGHNMITDDFENRYRFNEQMEDLEVGLSEVSGAVSQSEIREVDIAPKFPFQNSPINLKLSYKRPPSFGLEPVKSFIPDIENYKGRYEKFEDVSDPNSGISLNVGDVVYVDEPFVSLTPFGASRSTGFLRVIQEPNRTINVPRAASGAFTINTIIRNPGLRCPLNGVQILKDGVEIYFNDGETENKYGNSACETAIFRHVVGNQTFTIDRRNITNTFTGSDFTIIINQKTWEWATPGFSNLLEEVYIKAYERNSGGTEAEWLEIEDYESNYFTNRASSFNSSLRNDFEGDTDLLPFELSASYNNTLPFEVKINRLIPDTVSKDIKLEIVRRRRGFAITAEDPVNFKFRDFQDVIASTVLVDIAYFPERLMNYPTIEEPTRTFALHAPWSANKVTEHFGKLLVYGSLRMPESVFVSAPEDVNLFYFPHLFRKEFLTDAKEPLESLIPFSSILVAQTANRTWGIKGTSPLVFLDEDAQVENPEAYRLFDINTGVGTIAYKTVRPVRNQLFFLSNQGLMSMVSLYATDDKYNVRPMDRNINNILPIENKAIAIQHDNQYWLAFPDSGQVFRYYIDLQAWVKDSFKNFHEFNGWQWVTTKDGVLRFITNPMTIESGDHLTVYEGIVDKALTTDFNKNITSQFLTADLDQGQPFHTKRYREVKFDFALQNQFLPPLVPLDSESNKVGEDYIIEFDVERNHIYQIELDLPTLNPEDEIPDYFDIGDISLTPTGPEFRIEDNTIIIEANLFDGKVTLTIDGKNEIIGSEDAIVTDITYDFNVVGNVFVESDGQIINRITTEQYNTIAEVQEISIDDLQKEQFLGTRFRVFKLGDTPFGDIKRNVQTSRVSGTGYSIAVFMKDESRSKWTLETLGIAYRMRKTRSR